MSEIQQAHPVSSPQAGTLPQDLESLLAHVGEERRQIYTLVRNFLGELEQAASWKLLYNPPVLDTKMLEMGEQLIAVVASIPSRVDQLLQSLRADCDAPTREALEDAEFFLQGIHSMVAGELGRLEALLEEHRQSASARPLTPKTRAFLCEIAGDLKGKYSSALMGATTAIVAEGFWNPIEVEPVLFEEKAAECRRNERLADGLAHLVASVERLDLELPLEEMLARWSERQRTDPWALADLTVLSGQIAQLLKIENRRALYSGDFHEIRGRERDLSARLAQLESLQRRTWDLESGQTNDTDFDHSIRVMLEIVAMIDVNLLARQFGRSTLEQLRLLGSAQGTHGEPGETAPGGVSSLPPALQTLPPLFAREDLKTFLSMLAGAVSRRASLRSASVLQADTTTQDRLPETEELPGEMPSVTEILTSIDPEAVPAAIVVGHDAASEASEEITPIDEGAAMARLRAILGELQSPDNPNRRNVLMLERLLGRHARVPRAMLKQTEPYVNEVLRTLLPELVRLEPLGLVPAGAAGRLQVACAALLAAQTGTQSSTRVLALLEQNQKLLEEVSSMVQDYLLSQLS